MLASRTRMSRRACKEALMNFAVSRILVPLDFSPHLELALRYATALAGRLGALIEIIHVVEEPVATTSWGSEISIPDLPGLRDNLIADAERQLNQYRSTTESARVRR